MSSQRSTTPAVSLLQLRLRLDRLPSKSPNSAAQITAAAQLHDISVITACRTISSGPQIMHSTSQRLCSAPGVARSIPVSTDKLRQYASLSKNHAR